MSYVGAMPHDSLAAVESDDSSMIDACLARLRSEVGFAGHAPILSTLDLLLKGNERALDFGDETETITVDESDLDLEIHETTLETSQSDKLRFVTGESAAKLPSAEAIVARVVEDNGPKTEPLIKTPLPSHTVSLANPTIPKPPLVPTISPPAMESGIVAAVALPVPARVVLTRKKSFLRRMGWPVFLCGFVGGVFGGMAVMKSPVAKKPAIQQVLKKVNAVSTGAKTRLAHR